MSCQEKLQFCSAHDCQKTQLDVAIIMLKYLSDYSTISAMNIENSVNTICKYLHVLTYCEFVWIQN